MIIGTHNGKFHADEVMATAILEEIYPSASIIRSRDKDVLNSCDIVYDVGGGKYDHHGLEKKIRKNGIPYASAGLIWGDFGNELLKKWNIQDEQQIKQIIKFIDDSLISEIDAVDNGVDIYERKYDEVSINSISSIVNGFNLSWCDTDNENEVFSKSVDFCKVVLNNKIKSAISLFKSKTLLEKDFKERIIPQVVVLSKGYPWKKNLIDMNVDEILYVVFQDKSSGTYRLQVVPKSMDTMDARKNLPSSWWGKRGKEFSELTGIDDGIFCHPSGFIAGANSYESIMKLANIAINS